MKVVLDRVLTWPKERQASVAQMITFMEEQDKGTLRLTDEQLAEVRRRRAHPSAKRISFAKVFKHFRAPRA